MGSTFIHGRRLALAALLVLAACDGGSVSGDVDVELDVDVDAELDGVQPADVGDDGTTPDAADVDADVLVDALPDSDAETGPSDDADVADGDVPGDGAGPAELGIISTPREVALVGQLYRYRLRVDGVGQPEFTLEEAPAGMEIVDGERIEWVATAAQAGSARVQLRAALGERTGSQGFDVQVVKATSVAKGTVQESGGTVAVLGGAAEGASIEVPAGALKASRLISLSLLSEAVLPDALRDDVPVLAVALGPGGTKFEKSVKVSVPVAPELADKLDQLEVFMLQTQTGCWTGMEVGHVDNESELLGVEASHFSILVAGLPAHQLTQTLGDTAASDGCPKSTVATAMLTTPLAEVPAKVVTTLDVGELEPAAGNDVASVVNHPQFTGSLRAIWTVELLLPGSPAPIAAEVSLAVTLVVTGDGGARVVVADPHGAVHMERSYPSLATAWGPILEPLLRGSGLRFRLGASSATELSTRTRLYLRYHPGDAGTLPYGTMDQGLLLAQARSTPGPLLPTANALDADCDMVADSIDPPASGPAPAVDAHPGMAMYIVVGSPALLSCGIDGQDVAFEWSSTEASDVLDVGPGGAELTVSALGQRTIICAADVEGEVVSHAFSVYADAAIPENKAPSCTVTVADPVLAAGQSTTVIANIGDPDDDPLLLGFEWGVVNGSGELVPSALFGSLMEWTTSLGPGEPGTAVQVACRATDGALTSPLKPVTVTFLPVEANPAPTDALLTPAGASVGLGESVVFSASAVDSEALTFNWKPSALLSVSESGPGGSKATFSSAAPGLYTVQVEISDGTNPAVVATATVAVVESDGALVDADGDGFGPDTEPADCDDSRPGVNPGAIEVCGNDRDEDCDGALDEGFGAGCPKLEGDSDGDGVDDGDDNCPETPNPKQLDGDGDGVGDLCDVGCPASCDDGLPCTVDSCDGETGTCLHIAKVCNDKNACTKDTCTPATGACAFAPRTGACDDGDVCTAGDACAAGSCVGTPADCDDGDPCNGAEVCSGEVGCVSGPAPGCADADPCTVDSCIAGVGCSHTPLNCPAGEVCQGGSCLSPQACTIDADCDPLDDGDLCNGTLTCADGSCQVDPATVLACDDNNACNGVESCDALAGCQSGQAPVCDDGDACNGTESCDPVAGCLAGIALTCDDGDVCNGLESCVGALGCTSGTPLECSDESACNGVESCHPTVGCLGGQALVCSDGDPCNGVEICAPESGCEAGVAPDCDDGDGCTVDSCEAGVGCKVSPVSCPDGEVCQEGTCAVPADCMVDGDCAAADDNNLCNGALSCQGGECLVDPATVVSCDTSGDGPCEATTCVPATGLCVSGAANEGEPCDDGEGCTVGDACGGGACLPGAPKVCNDGLPCTADTCEAGNCAFTAVACDDGNPCTIDSCDAATGCVSGPVDCDEDGSPAGEDCEDDNPNKFPGNPEVCNGADEDCNGVVDDPDADGCTTFFVDGDEDGAGDPTDSACLCGPEFPFVAPAGDDCNDELASVKPGGTELCDGLDNDCNGDTDEGYDVGVGCDGPDSDACQNGIFECTGDGEGVVCNEALDGLEEACNGVDDDCDGLTDEDVVECDGDTCTLGDSCDSGVCTPGPAPAVCPGRFLFVREDIGWVIEGDPVAKEGSILTQGGFLVRPRGIVWESPQGVLIADAGAAGSGLFDGQVVHLDLTTLEQTQVSSGDLLDEVSDLVIEASGDILVSTGIVNASASGANRIVRIDRATGAQSILSEGGALSNAVGVAVTPNGSVYAIDGGAGPVIAIDPVTGAQTPLNGATALVGSPRRIEAVDDDTLLVTTWFSSDTLWKVDTNTGVETAVGSYTSTTGVAMDAAGQAVLVGAGTSVIHTVDLSDGASVGYAQSGLLSVFLWDLVQAPAPVPCADGSLPTGEVCDGLDNDCDGATDEGQAVTPTTCGVGQCAAAGVMECLGGSMVDSCEPDDPAVELCTGLDDDCDGATDEGFVGVGGKYDTDAHCGGCGNNCAGQIPDGTGVCDGSGPVPGCVVGSCDPGFAQTGPTACAPEGTECAPCLDDVDCPGGSCVSLTEGDACVLPCADGGVCAPGWTCELVGAGDERCVPDNGFCDCGPVNDGESRSCEATNAFGTCFGTEVCSASSGWGGCSASAALEEVCDGLDNNCNSLVDEDVVPPGSPCENTVGGVGTCTGDWTCEGPGGWTCDAATPEADATCDDQDNDCNGVTDDNFPLKGTVCSTPLGASCSTDGVVACDPGDPGATICADPVTSCGGVTCEVVTSVTDFVFHNNLGPAGELAEGYVAPTVAPDLGDPGVPELLAVELWGNGGSNHDLTTATNADFGTCTQCVRFFEDLPSKYSAPDAAREFFQVSGAMEVDPSTPLMQGDQGLIITLTDVVLTEVVLDYGADTYGFLRRAVTTPVAGGACVVLPSPLTLTSPPIAAAGDSDGDGWEVFEDCDDTDGENTPGKAEVCDGEDNDCDGVADDGMTYDGAALGEACTGPGACGAGTVECDPGGLGAICSTMAGGSEDASSAEICDGVDNDCDGITDGPGLVDAPPCTLFDGVCAGTVQACDGGAFAACTDDAYGPAYAPTETTCDGLDNDCDGGTDETHPTLGTPCTAGEGACQSGGVVVCTEDGTGVECGATPLPPGGEVCNGIDDDCNGLTDEEGAGGCTTFYKDQDGDEFGVTADSKCLCAVSGEYTATVPGDCNDGASTIRPGETELCDGIDQDCDDSTDETFPDTDSDGAADCVDADDDDDGLTDAAEAGLGTDPLDADTDNDGLSDLAESDGLRNPLDADTDDDGLLDGDEDLGTGPLAAAGFGPTVFDNPDSDGDGLSDGLEVGLTAGIAGGSSDGTGVSYLGTDSALFPDADPASKTDPNDDDTDDDGISDANEDLSADGEWLATLGTTGTPGSGETDPSNPDTDGDGLLDGLETGRDLPDGFDTDLGVFVADADNSTMTDPLDPDTDDGGVDDGFEDVYELGKVSPGETDPNVGADDGDGILGLDEDLGVMAFVESAATRLGCESGRDTFFVECQADELPVHGVVITRGFWMMQREVTRAQYVAFMGSDPSTEAGCVGDCPVDSVTWDQATAFADAVSVAQGLTPCGSTGDPYACDGWRLPTSAEWEVAARGGEPYSFAGTHSLSDVAWTSTDTTASHPGCERDANAYGVCDMSGNVWEFVWDWFEDYPAGLVVDPAGPDTGTQRVIRSGSWLFPEAEKAARPAYREPVAATLEAEDVGFRLVRTPDPDVLAPTAPFDMVTVPAGRFPMGCVDWDFDCEPDESPRHHVFLDAYFMDTLEVTAAQYEACVDAGACTVPLPNASETYQVAGKEDHPINMAIWQQAVDYCAWAGKRLPTEAEWEKAARGTDGRVWPWGDLPADCTLANFNSLSDGGAGCGTGGVAAVGARPEGASPYGALDMGGNVAEWTADWYGGTYYSISPVENPTGPAPDTWMVVRGGNMFTPDVELRCGDRATQTPSQDSPVTGFRCAGDPGLCGDDTLALGEQCDDGDVTPLDGCSDTCRLECQAFELDGLTNYFEFADDPDLRPGLGDYTVEALVYLTADHIADLYMKRDGSNYLALVSVETGYLSASADGASASLLGFDTDTGSTFLIGAWHHVALVRTASDFRVYFDGQLASGTLVAGSPPGPDIDNAGAHRWGAHAFSPSQFTDHGFEGRFAFAAIHAGEKYTAAFTPTLDLMRECAGDCAYVDFTVAGGTLPTTTSGTHALAITYETANPLVDGGLQCTTCGNGVVDAFESCDDGNNLAADGCSSTCQDEPCADAPDGTVCAEAQFGLCSADACVANTCPFGYDAVTLDDDGTSKTVCGAMNDVWGPRPVSPVGVYSVSEPVVGDKVVSDTQTELMWAQEIAPTDMDHAAAIAYCDTLDYAGFTDWRLPLMRELITLIDYSIESPGPLIDTVAFPEHVSGLYFAYNLQGPGAAWYVYLTFGSAGGTATTNNGFVSCVRTEGTYIRPDLRFEVSGDTTRVLDTWTSLEWQRTVVETMKTQAEADTYCDDLNLGGHTDWFLPDVRQLLGLADGQQSSPSIDSDAFPGTPTDTYWTSTPDIGSSSFNYVGFAVGHVVATSGTSLKAVRCARTDYCPGTDTLIAEDGDCDGVLTGDDCDDANPDNCGGTCTLSDIDFNTYATVLISGQCWMQENLSTATYSDGAPIPNVTDNAAWDALSTGAWADHSNDPLIGAVYGKLYNHHAVSTGLLCPAGWHVPSSADWSTIGIAGGSQTGGGAYKEVGLDHWNSPNTSATNSTGFTGLPGGLREVNGSFASLGARGHWWTDDTGVLFLYANSDNTSRFSQSADFGMSVRCVQD